MRDAFCPKSWRAARPWSLRAGRRHALELKVRAGYAGAAPVDTPVKTVAVASLLDLVPPPPRAAPRRDPFAEVKRTGLPCPRNPRYDPARDPPHSKYLYMPPYLTIWPADAPMPPAVLRLKARQAKLKVWAQRRMLRPVLTAGQLLSACPPDKPLSVCAELLRTAAPR